MKKKKKSPTIRPLGDILLDMEPLLQEAMDDHELQWGDMLGLIHHYLTVHYPNSKEIYNDGTETIYFYGHQDLLKNLGRKRSEKRK